MQISSSAQRPTQKPKRVKYPYFRAIGTVVINNPAKQTTLRLVETTYCSHREEIDRLLNHRAHWSLQCAGLSEQQVNALEFSDVEITALYAVDARGVRRNNDEPVEAFFDYGGLPKRDLLIRQRRVVPWDTKEMVAIYGGAPTTATEARA